MKRNRKAIVSFALAVLMTVLVLPITALAAPAPAYGISYGTDYITVNLNTPASDTNHPFSNYTVRLYGSGYDNTYTRNAGDSVTFSGLNSGTSYTLVVTANYPSVGAVNAVTTTITTNGSAYNYNYDKTVISKPTPYTGGNAVFMVAGEYGRFNGVSLNGYALSNGSQYTSEYYDYNRVRVTIYANALEKLANGYHSVVFSFSNGYASTNFQVSRSATSVRPPVTTTLSANYTVTASSLRVREFGSTSARQIGSLARGAQVTVLETSNGWGRVSYYGKTGWVSMQYLRAVGTTSSNIIIAEPVTSTSAYGVYYTTVALRMRSGPSTSYNILGVLPAGTAVTVTSIDSGWALCSISGQTVYVSTNYLRK